jgi:sulfide dehydrogenase subunit beta
VYEIVGRQDFSPTTFLLEVSHPPLARAARPGQFVIVMSRPEGERIPLTIADFSPVQGTVTMVVQAAGRTTLEMQRSCAVGTSLHALAGPMGKPSGIRGSNGSGQRVVVCVGGGLGVAPTFPIARALKEAGNYVIGIVGFRSRDLIFWQDRFTNVSDELILCTDDGSAGLQGFVTDGLRQAIDSHPVIDEVFAIGPPVMMKFCAATTRPHGISTVVSLNPIMIDATGMCGGCRVTVGGQTRFACVDGPDFDGHQVDFDELMRRLTRFKREEQLALETVAQ